MYILPDNSITIVRSGDPQKERAVQLRQGRNHWWVNPRTQVGLAVAPTQIDRAGCIQSFAKGLVASGHRVFIEESRQDRFPGTYEFGSSEIFAPAYFAFGLAYGLNQWVTLCGALSRYISPEQRLAVLEETGRFYSQQRPWPSISLRLPIA